MPDKRTENALERLNAMSRQQLQQMLVDSAKMIGESKKQIRQKDKLIADITSQREKAQKEADKILNTAKAQAAAIREKARAREEEAERQLDDVTAEVARKLTNANTEADSIVKSKLSAAKADIEEFERKREESKRLAITLNDNIVERYDGLISKVSEQISSFKDIQQDLKDFNAEIKSEDFKKFNMSDYISSIDEEDDLLTQELIGEMKEEKLKKEPLSARKKVKPSIKPILDVENDDITLDDDDLEALANVFDDEFVDEEQDVPRVSELDDTDLLSDDDFDFLDPVNDLGRDDDLNGVGGDIEEIELTYDDLDIDDDDMFSNEEMKSFTSSFMAVRATDGDDLDDIDLSSILEEDDEEEPAPSQKIAVPARPRRRSGKNANPGRWLS